MAALNKFLEWVSRLAFLNILWLGFTLLGAGILGLFPSITATFSVMRKWVNRETDIPVFKTFWQSYKKEFVKSNILGYILSILGYILYLDFVFLTVSDSSGAVFLTIPFIVISIIFLLTLCYIFPVFVHYDMKIVQVIKSSFFIMMLNPMPTIVMLLGVLGIGIVLWNFQGLILCFGVSVLAFVIMMPAHRAFQKVSNKSARLPFRSVQTGALRSKIH